MWKSRIRLYVERLLFAVFTRLSASSSVNGNPVIPRASLTISSVILGDSDCSTFAHRISGNAVAPSPMLAKYAMNRRRVVSLLAIRLDLQAFRWAVCYRNGAQLR